MFYEKGLIRLLLFVCLMLFLPFLPHPENVFFSGRFNGLKMSSFVNIGGCFIHCVFTFSLDNNFNIADYQGM